MVDVWQPAHVERKPLPIGERGTRMALSEVAKRATEGRNNPVVHAWATRKLQEAGTRPSTDEERVKILLDAFRTEFLWIPDPIHTEMMVGAHLLFGGIFGGGDCDDLTIAFLAALLAIFQTVGVRVAVVGHAYALGQDIVHVLGAVWIDKKWHRFDPSYSQFEFGKCEPWSRERIITLPDLKVLCDAANCLSGPQMHSPERLRGEGDFIGVHGIPPLVANELLNDFIHADGPLSLAGNGMLMATTTPPTPTAVLLDSTSTAWIAYFGEQRRSLQEAWDKALASYNRMMNVAQKLGYTLPDPPPTEGSPRGFGWSPADQQIAIDTQAMVMLSVQLLTDVMAETRHVQTTPDRRDLLIEGLATDTLAIGRQEGSAPYLFNPKTGENVEVTTTGLGNPWVVGGAFAFGAVATVSAVFALKFICHSMDTVAEHTSKTMIFTKMADLVQSGQATADQASAMIATLDVGIIGAKEADAKKEESSKSFFSFSNPLFLVGGLTLAGTGVYLATRK